MKYLSVGSHHIHETIARHCLRRRARRVQAVTTQNLKRSPIDVHLERWDIYDQQPGATFQRKGLLDRFSELSMDRRLFRKPHS